MEKNYKIARLEDDDEFGRVSKDPRLHPEITDKELDAIIAREPQAPPNTEMAKNDLAAKRLACECNFTGLSAANAVRVYGIIVTLSETEIFKVSASATLQQLIDAEAE